MKDKVDRILNGEAVDIAGDGADYYLSVSKNSENYKIGFTCPDNIKRFYSPISLKSIKDAGERLIALADELAEELESRKKFKTNERIYYVRTNGEIHSVTFSESYSLHLSLLAMGNAFKTHEEAEAHKDEVLAKYQELRDKGLV